MGSAASAIARAVTGAITAHAVLAVVAQLVGHPALTDGHRVHMGAAGVGALVSLAVAVRCRLGSSVHAEPGRGVIAPTSVLGVYLATETVMAGGELSHVVVDPWLWLAPIAVIAARLVLDSASGVIVAALAVVVRLGWVSVASGGPSGCVYVGGALRSTLWSVAESRAPPVWLG
ncbi:hypothetical protein [Euzebya sp.]|uniref:hypothetical protein n=1 Tax=Euzebya sp. TaxID=1971409 RepID=UPI003515E70E